MLTMGNVPLARFATLNAFGALIWAVVGAGSGFLFRHTVESYLGNMRKYSLQIFGGDVGAVALGDAGALLAQTPPVYMMSDQSQRWL
ncbi:hypothetical protein DFAR_3410002 [Desulfarculales bacterium]